MRLRSVKRITFVLGWLTAVCAAHSPVKGENVLGAAESWEPVKTVRMTRSRSLIVTRRAVPHPNPKRKNYEYQFTVTDESGTDRVAPWRAIATDLRELGPSYQFDVAFAGWDDDGYLILVLKDMRVVSVRIVDMHPGADRIDVRENAEKPLVEISDVNGPDVKSATFTGSVGTDNLTVRLDGTRIARGKAVDGELMRVSLVNDQGRHRWVVTHPGN